ncbi:MAG TPA: arylesterase [Gemmatimonadaceae bacterium]|jgi:acyl-CoA thioesterase-1|nr:arylesterase [Gemmatimonadaceae bacterium]
MSAKVGVKVTTAVAWVALATFAMACGRDASRQESNQEMRDTGQSASDSSRPGARAPEKDARKTILFVGTSLTAGYGIDPQQAYPALIQRKLDSLGYDYEAVNAGVSGETSSGAVHRMDWLMKQPFDVFVLETGANDGLRGLPIDSLRANIQQILDEVKRTHPQAKILLVGMEALPNMGGAYVSGFRVVYGQLAKRNDVAYLPFLLKGVAGIDTLNQRDMVHPNPRGAQIIAETVWGALQGLLEKGAKTRA